MSDLDDLVRAVADRKAARLGTSRRCCLRCGHKRLSLFRGYCHRCKRDIRLAKEKRADDLILLNAKRGTELVEQSAEYYERLGWVRVGNLYVDPGTIRAVEPYELSGIFRAVWGPPVYGWDIYFFHGAPGRIAFDSPEAASRWLQYLGSRAPHVQIIHREVQVSWWVSF